MQVAPAVRAAIGEEFGYPMGTPLPGSLAAALRRLGGTAHVSEIYQELKGHAKAEKNRNPEAKIRQTLQINSMFVSKERGVWQIA